MIHNYCKANLNNFVVLDPFFFRIVLKTDSFREDRRLKLELLVRKHVHNLSSKSIFVMIGKNKMYRGTNQGTNQQVIA